MNDHSARQTDILSTADLASDESRASATPMMEQYIEIKAANPDSMLFYRMGDFYELFFQDAVDASRALGITLTKRGQHMGLDIPMCGVPVHAADDYLQKLIAVGFRVAVCEQVEDPAEARKRGSKSVVRRDVVRLVTPGTLTEEKLLSPSDANYLMAVARIRGGGEPSMALAWIDISTGIFRLSETAQGQLLADILRIDPRELIVPDTLFHDPEFRPVLDVVGARRSAGRSGKARPQRSSSTRRRAPISNWCARSPASAAARSSRPSTARSRAAARGFSPSG